MEISGTIFFAGVFILLIVGALLGWVVGDVVRVLAGRCLP